MKTLEGDELHIIEIDSSRIIQECYFMNATHENYWRHQYSLNMLNEKNEVISAFYPVNQDKSECMAHLKKVEKILKGAPRVRLCVRDRLETWKEKNTKHQIFDFGSLGKYQTSYYALTFDKICNSTDCVSISDAWTKTCPGFPK